MYMHMHGEVRVPTGMEGSYIFAALQAVFALEFQQRLHLQRVSFLLILLLL